MKCLGSRTSTTVWDWQKPSVLINQSQWVTRSKTCLKNWCKKDLSPMWTIWESFWRFTGTRLTWWTGWSKNLQTIHTLVLRTCTSTCWCTCLWRRSYQGRFSMSRIWRSRRSSYRTALWPRTTLRISTSMRWELYLKILWPSTKYQCQSSEPSSKNK